MQQIKLKDFKVIPILDSARHLDISDDEYFGSKYVKYISNSKLASICPAQGGSMAKFYGPSEHINTSSLALGTAVHCCTLQPDDFTLAPKIGKPTAKLGQVCDAYVKYIKRGLSKEESAQRACIDAQYYINQIANKIPKVIEAGDIYYTQVKDFDNSIITLDDRSWDTATQCIKNLKLNSLIQSKLHPTDDFMDELPSFNEDTLFLDFLVTYQDSRCTTLHMKGKLDNWTINEESKLLTLNDLKTTSHILKWFTHREYGSLYKYHYLRQLKLYQIMLENLCTKLYGYNKKQWSFDTNILAVETTRDCNSQCINIREKQLQEGEEELMDCLKRVGYYEIFGHKEEVEFI